jgi:hypothetical protein
MPLQGKVQIRKSGNEKDCPVGLATKRLEPKWLTVAIESALIIVAGSPLLNPK